MRFHTQTVIVNILKRSAEETNDPKEIEWEAVS
jgi:hypothetical protein